MIQIKALEDVRLAVYLRKLLVRMRSRSHCSVTVPNWIVCAGFAVCIFLG